MTYDVRQSSLVPAAVPPPPAPPQPVAPSTGLFVGDSTLTFLSRPRLAPDATAGLWIPRTQLSGAITVTWERMLMRVTFAAGLSEGAMSAAPTTISNPGEPVVGLGFGNLVYVTPPAWRLHVAFGFDWMVWAVPSYVIATCLPGVACGLAPADRASRRHQRTPIPTAAPSIHVAWRAYRDLRLLARLVAQNHPTNSARFASERAAAELSTGPWNVIVGAGAELALARWLSFSVQMDWPITQAPVVYGPILSAGFRLETD